MPDVDEIKRLVDRLEQSMAMAAEAATDQKAIIEEAKEEGFTAGEIAAIKKMASLKVKDGIRKERTRLAHLARVGEAVGVDLFSFMEDPDA